MTLHPNPRSEVAMDQSLSPASVIQFVASTTRLCASLFCRVPPPLVCQLVLEIDGLEHIRESEVRRAHRRQKAHRRQSWVLGSRKPQDCTDSPISI